MAATGPKARTAVLSFFVLVCGLPVRADRVADVRAEITYVASALANGNPSDALLPFDKAFPEYDKLTRYFEALTNSFEIASEVEIVDEDDAENQTTVQANWTVQLSDRVSNSNLRRTYKTTIQLKPDKGKWKIVAFSPVEMFNPQSFTAGK